MAKVSSVRQESYRELDPKTQAVVGEAAVQEVGLLRKRIGELEGQLATKPNKPKVWALLVGYALRLTLVLVLLVAAAAVGHRLWVWGGLP
jgi:hypothetical protein